LDRFACFAEAPESLSKEGKAMVLLRFSFVVMAGDEDILWFDISSSTVGKSPGELRGCLLEEGSVEPNASL
jgi:hypothetical protein